MAHKDEITLIERCKKGKASAQRELYECFFNYAMSVALRYSQHRDEAIEVVNDAFLKVFNSLEQYDTAQLFKTWLRTIVVRTSIDQYRKNRKYYETESHLYVENDPVEPDVFSAFGSEEIMACVQKLPPSYRVVFVLYVVEGYKHHEIAQMLQVTEGTSKSNLAAARNKLKQLLTATSHPNSSHYAR